MARRPITKRVFLPDCGFHHHRIMKKPIKIILWIVGAIVGLYLILFLVGRIIFTPRVLVSQSMEPTITEQDFNYVSNFHYTFFGVKRNDIVLFKPHPELFPADEWIHRVIA